MMNPQPMCWQTALTTVIGLITVSLVEIVIVIWMPIDKAPTFTQTCILFAIAIVGDLAVVAMATDQKWFLDWVLSKIPIKGSTPAAEDKKDGPAS